MKKITLLALTALTVSNSQAQVAVTPVVGLNVSNYKLTLDNVPFKENKSLIGYCAGALVDIPLTDHFSLQPGALYKLNGFRTETADVKETISVNTIEIPVKLVFSCNIGKDNRLFISGGPYAGINLSGKYRLVGNLSFDSSNYISAPHHVDFTSKIMFGGRYDIGAGVSIGVKTHPGIFVSVQGQYGIKDLGSGSLLLMHIHNYNFGIVGGYTFKFKKHKATAEAVKAQ